MQKTIGLVMIGYGLGVFMMGLVQIGQQKNAAAAAHDAFTARDVQRLVQAQEAQAAAACALLKRAPGGAFPAQCEVYVGTPR